MTPYYDRAGIRLFLGDCREVLPTLPEKSAGLVLTDPPYDAYTHERAKTNKGTGSGHALIEFSSLTEEELVALLADIGRVASRWVVATIDWRHMHRLNTQPPAGLRFMRFGIWVKPDGMPQISADRPAASWEAIAMLHREDRKPSWNGGGGRGFWIHNVARGNHPTEKPVPLLCEWMGLFSDPGESILDPFAGSGSTLVAALRMQRPAIGIELEEKYCEIAAKRLDRELAQGDLFVRRPEYRQDNDGVAELAFDVEKPNV